MNNLLQAKNKTDIEKIKKASSDQNYYSTYYRKINFKIMFILSKCYIIKP